VFSEFKDAKHREQAEEILVALGRFTVAFERVCEAMRLGIMFALRSQGLNNPGMEQVIIGDTTSAQLQVLLGALFNHLPGQDDGDRGSVRSLLQEVKELTERRNIALHAAWRFGDGASECDLHAVAIRQRTKQNSGAHSEVHGISAAYLDELTEQAKAAQVRLQRLHICMNQSSFKVSTQLRRSL
jgi:hypothetical protein